MSGAPAPVTEPAPRLGAATKIGYGLGNFACMLGKQAPKQLSLPVYNVALGVDPASVGGVLALGRLWDAFTDPFVGHWTDRARSRWGRRKPFLFVGSILTGFFFAAMWFLPRGWSESAYLAYFACTSFLFYLALTVYSVPWYAMGYELAKSYDERTSLMAYPSALGPVAQIAVSWLYAITQLSVFSDTLEGVRYVGAGAGVLLVLFGLMPVWLVKEDPLAAPPTSAATKQERPPGLAKGVRDSFANRPFLALTVAFTFVMIGSSLVSGLGFYVHTYCLYAGDTKAAGVLSGWVGTASLLTTMICTPAASWLARRFGKKEIFCAGIAWATVRMALLWSLIDPAHPYLMLVNAVMLGVEQASIFMLCHAMIADVCDVDELRHGVRREGLFGAIYAWVFKTGIAMSFALSGYILGAVGFDRSLGGAQPAETLQAMKAAYCVAPAVLYLAALAMMRGYDLDKRRMGEVSRGLAERKTARSAA